MGPIERLQAGIAGFSRAGRKTWVTLSYAQSLDGSLAARRGAPLQLSGPKSLRLTHQLRAAHQAILVGIGTVLADNPRLTVRLVPGDNPQPVVLDSRLRTPLNSKLLDTSVAATLPPWIATTHRTDSRQAARLQSRGARLLRLPAGEDGWVDLPPLLDCLAALGVNRLMVEGGARVIHSFLAQGLVDFLVLTIAPVFVGGLHALQNLPENGLPALDPPFPRLHQAESMFLDEDLIIWGGLDVR